MPSLDEGICDGFQGQELDPQADAEPPESWICKEENILKIATLKYLTEGSMHSLRRHHLRSLRCSKDHDNLREEVGKGCCKLQNLDRKIVRSYGHADAGSLISCPESGVGLRGIGVQLGRAAAFSESKDHLIPSRSPWQQDIM